MTLCRFVALGCLCALPLSLPAQQDAPSPPPQLKPRVPQPVPVPPLPQAGSATRGGRAEPTDPPAQTVQDSRAHLSFHLPAGWNLARQDGEVSTFRLDARTAPRTTQVHEVATLAFNPYPLSTFSGALFYVTEVPHSTLSACAAQTSSRPQHLLPPATIDDVAFTRGHDEHGKICTEARDIAYTALRGGACLRFDLVVNTFCGGDVSGAADMTAAQLTNIFGRLESILQTVHFDRDRR